MTKSLGRLSVWFFILWVSPFFFLTLSRVRLRWVMSLQFEIVESLFLLPQDLGIAQPEDFTTLPHNSREWAYQLLVLSILSTYLLFPLHGLPFRAPLDAFFLSDVVSSDLGWRGKTPQSTFTYPLGHFLPLDYVLDQGEIASRRPCFFLLFPRLHFILLRRALRYEIPSAFFRFPCYRTFPVRFLLKTWMT